MWEVWRLDLWQRNLARRRIPALLLVVVVGIIVRAIGVFLRAERKARPGGMHV